jgi:hypothetical protein
MEGEAEVKQVKKVKKVSKGAPQTTCGIGAARRGSLRIEN